VCYAFSVPFLRFLLFFSQTKVERRAHPTNMASRSTSNRVATQADSIKRAVNISRSTCSEEEIVYNDAKGRILREKANLSAHLLARPGRSMFPSDLDDCAGEAGDGMGHFLQS
jgi:hypothetical protein